MRSYFNRGDGRLGIERMVERIARIEVIVTSTEAEALHLEQNLVKRHRPPFNVRLRDDKSFPYIAVTVADEYPRVMFTRERHRRGTVYFGPYANAKKVRETLDVLNRVFQFRPCEGPKPGRHSGIPCLDFHIERCTAPCIGAISKDEYREQIDGVIDFLSGDTRSIVRSLEQRMREASAEERFEDATRYRNRLFAIESLAERQGADRRDVGTIDVIGLAVDGDRAAVQLFPLRDGKLIDRYAFHLENVEGQDRATILEGFCLEYYTAAPSVPPQLIVPSDLTDTEALAGFLSELRGAAVEVRAPARGEKKRLAELAAENAELALAHETTAAEQKRLRRIEALESLRESLNLESLPVRIECFDISNLQGRDIVAVDDGLRRRAAEEGALPLVHGARPRRAGRLRVDGAGRSLAASRGCATAARPTATTRASRPIPNLVVIDGGKGQLAAALEAIQATAGLPRVAVIALAKREEEVFVPGRSAPDPARPARSRAPAPAAHPRRGAPVRGHVPPPEARHARVRVDLRHARRASGRRGGARSCITSARPIASSRPRRRSSRPFRDCPRRRHERCTGSFTAPGGQPPDLGDVGARRTISRRNGTSSPGSSASSSSA